jgi:hypothetical protein
MVYATQDFVTIEINKFVGLLSLDGGNFTDSFPNSSSIDGGNI